MVTRVDKKPIIYNTCLIRAIKPAVVSNNRRVLDLILSRAVGCNIPAVSTRDLLEDYEDIEHAFKLFGIDDPTYQIFGYIPEEEEDEVIRLARVCLDKAKSIRQLLRSEALCDSMCDIQKKIIGDAKSMYFGTEGAYKVFAHVLNGSIFGAQTTPNYAKWSVETAKKILLTQSPYMLIHPTAVNDMAEAMGRDMNQRVWNAWDLYKKTETLAIRIGSRKNMLAHSYYSGICRKGFEPDRTIEKDFMLPLTGYAQVEDHVKVYMVLGLRYICIEDEVCVLSHDDCVNLATMAQCYFRTIMYFSMSNGYKAGTQERAHSLILDIAVHCCRLIDAKKNFSHIIRSMHILSQGEFNDAFEVELGCDLGWRERSENYKAESKTLDPMGATFHRRAVELAVDRIDRLNTCFIYHVFVGDEMHISDLRNKVSNMTSKVRPANKTTWDDFIRFTKTYLLCRFMYVHKKKPRCGGNTLLLNARWAERCVEGQFTMPPHSDWGKVWVENEFSYTDFADIWHLEAQDVAYVVKDSDGLVGSKYVSDKLVHSELLMAMTNGNILDPIAKSTPRKARKRIMDGLEVKEVVITTAPKAENAKPTWKKRVTFAADCEFRKMQAEFDRNCRRVMTFVRGPSLGVDQCILEKQFADIADATATGLDGAICSHDISAWSESMDRDRKFEFEQVLIQMFSKPEMINIKNDWQKINAVVSKQGCKDIVKIDNGSFQGFDGSSSTILHSLILIYCIDTARRKDIIKTDVKTNMATLIDDCIALMVNLHKINEATAFWAHLKETYLELGFEVDDLKSIFSTIKAIYLSRRFMSGGEVPADFKVFIKAHSSYEDPLRCTLDAVGDIFGAMRGACDANGEAWFIYFCSCLSVLAEIAHNNNCVMSIPSHAAAIFALAPVVENGWGFPSIISWCTNDVTDKRSHFNAIMELAAIHACQSEKFTRGVDVYPRVVAKAMYAIKSQAWRMVSYSNIFTNPFEALREGPLKPDMLRRNAVQELLAEVATAEPWASLLSWSSSATTMRVREMLIQSGPLHAPTLSALVNCMPDNYRLSLVGKAVGSISLLGLLPGAKRVILKRRVIRCSQAYFGYTKAIYESSNDLYTHEDCSSLTYIEKTQVERSEFYAANGVLMIDHTFPDPLATFTVSAKATQSIISPNLSALRIWDKTKNTAHRTNQLISDKGVYVPRRSGRVWEVTCEHAKGWDSVSQRVAMGLAILARAKADGHCIDGLLMYFIKSWNELSNITPEDTHLISIHGSIKRLDANPGSSTHPIIVNRNILRGFNNKIKSALDAIPGECKRMSGVESHLHDFLAHETAMTCLTALMFSTFQYLGVTDYTLSYNIATRVGVVVPESALKMSTGRMANMIKIEIMDGEDNYGLLQACPELIKEIAIPTMKSSWVRMINALMDRNLDDIESLRKEATSGKIEEVMEALRTAEAKYSPSVIIAEEPASRRSFVAQSDIKLAIIPNKDSARAHGDGYTTSVRMAGSRFSRALSEHQPSHVMAATAVRSLVWSRLKDLSAVQLSKHLYMDPDADDAVLGRCGTRDFWRGAITEISKLKRDSTLSETTMSAFRSLGVIDIHLTHSNDISDVTHAVASFFGARLRKVVIIISDLVTSLAGRKDGDFAKPFSEKIITNNPALMNAKFRKNHIVKLIQTNIEMYKERIDKIIKGEVTHRGDKRAIEQNTHHRLVDLRCRMYTYSAVDVADTGSASINYKALGATIKSCSERVFDKVGCNKELIPESADTLENIIRFMFKIDRILRAENKHKKSGWHAESGQVGMRLAVSTIEMDAEMVMGTKFAVSASEIAPKIKKRVIHTDEHVPDETAAAIESLMFSDDDSDGDNLLDMDEDAIESAMWRGKSSVEIEMWKVLYSLLVCGHYSIEQVNSVLGTSMAGRASPAVLREAHLEDFTDREIEFGFPDAVADYFANGLVFNPEWLNRDEADAYTTDEMFKIQSGFLF